MRRLATAADIDRVYAIYMHQAVIPFLGHDPMPRGAFAAVYEELLRGAGFFVFEVGGQIAGFYSVLRGAGRARHVAEIGTVAIDPAARGRGFGSAMLEEALAALRASGIIRVQLLVESDNVTALDFYEKLGFRVEGTMRRAYKRAAEAQYVDERVLVRFLD